MTLPALRRVVTGHDTSGRSVVAEIGPPPTVFKLDVVDVLFHELWSTAQTPVVVDDGPDPVRGPVLLPPPANGTRLRIIDIPPDTPQLLQQGAQAMQGVFAKIGDGRASTATRHPAMHRTESVDYGVVLQGSITLVLDAQVVELTVGDVVVQRGTNHAWANRSGAVCRMLFVLIDGRFGPALRERLGGRAS
jgi:mannose-6-phosphate isomerase-like protein (cupin superfamily)